MKYFDKNIMPLNTPGSNMSANRNTFLEVQNYYNAISNDYDNAVNTEINVMVRNYVKDYFIKAVKPTTVMDFGGGTGLDIPWLTGDNYSILFCETSEGMRVIAKERIEHQNLGQKVEMLPDSISDFHTWNENNLPCDRLNAVIANFNVLNNISEMDLLFKKLARIMNDGGHFIATVLNYSFWSLIKRSRSIAYKSLVSNDPLRVDTKSNGIGQPVFIYSDNHLRKAYSNYFKLILDKSIQNTGFRLLHLQKFN